MGKASLSQLPVVVTVSARQLMRVIHVLPAIAEEASGPSYSVVRLCQSLLPFGNDVSLAVLDWSPVPDMPEFVKTFPIGLGPRRLGRSPQMWQWLLRQAAAKEVDVLHNHGMWQMNSVYPGRAMRYGRTKLIVSPRGAFSPWAMNHGSNWKKIFWPLLQRPALERTSCFHATAESEYKEVRRLGFQQPVAVIPNGIDVPALVPKRTRCLRKLVFLGRIHPVKGIESLLRAWATLMDSFAEWQVLIVGTDAAYNVGTGYLDEMKSLAATLKLKRLEFLLPLYGKAKLEAYREAELFVLPTHSENFGMTVAEALAAGTPAIVTKGAPWRGLETHKCGWWIEVGVESLAACLRQSLCKSPYELRMMGLNGREWMIRDFSWQSVGNRMDQVYRWITRGDRIPSFVYTS